MSKSTKSTPATGQATPANSHEDTPPHHEKGFLNLAGEAFVVLGEEIVEGKDKVIEVVGEKITTIKSAISNLTHKKKAAPKKVAPKKVAPAKKKAAPAKKKAAPAKKKAAPGKKKAAPAKKKAAPAKNPTAVKKKPATVKKKATAVKKKAPGKKTAKKR